jgi:maltokinase
VSTVDPRQLEDYLSRQRWYAGSSDEVSVAQLRPLGWLQEPGTGLGVRIVIATLADTHGTQYYNLPLSYRRDPAPALEHALIGSATFDDVDYLVFDALHDPDAVKVLLAGFRAPRTTIAGLDYHLVDDLELPDDPSTVLLSVEQSNSSVIVDETAMLKVFRRISPGRNPDVEVLGALSPEYADIVPRLFGWLSTDSESPLGGCDLAILQAFLRTATEGWESARASVRDLLAEPDVPADEAGGDFAGEAERLGVATRQVHDGMARLLPSGTWGPPELAVLADYLSLRFERAAQLVPELTERREAVAEHYDAVRALTGPVPVQRIHGDLHLGQTLRTSIGWKLIDFEGEPARPLAERTQLDSPMRDVAGMLRSFDYAAQSVLVQVGVTDEAEGAATAWTDRNRDAFLRGYGPLGGADDELLLRAYEVDKAVYETLYEALHRPSWLHIPLRALP